MKLYKKLTLKELHQFHSLLLRSVYQFEKDKKDWKELCEINKQRFIEMKQQNEQIRFNLQQIENVSNEKIKTLVEMYNSLLELSVNVIISIIA